MGPQRNTSYNSAHEHSSDPLAVRPHLHLIDATAVGVTLAFDARLMSHHKFRASMPIRCASCREELRERLVIRPLAWVIKLDGTIVADAEVSARYECKVDETRSSREMINGLRTISEFPAPFNEPFPFYICTSCSPVASIHAEAVGTSGMPQCHVTVPSARYALEWLERVNGVCGDDFADLECRVHQFESPRWQAVPAKLRERLGVWFSIRAGERFDLYVSDRDFRSCDAGLAGAVFTDQRLVYRKYHRGGEIEARQFDRLRVEVESGAPSLAYRNGRSRKVIVKLHQGDATSVDQVIADQLRRQRENE